MGKLRLSDRQHHTLVTAAQGPIVLVGHPLGGYRWAIFGLERHGYLSRDGNRFLITEAGRAALRKEPDNGQL